MNAPVRRDCHAFRLRTSAQPRWSRRRGRVALPFVKGRLTLHLRLLDALPLISFQLSSRRRSQRHSSQPLISPTIYLAGSSTPCFPTPRPYTLPRFPSIPYTLHSFFFFIYCNRIPSHLRLPVSFCPKTNNASLVYYFSVIF